MGSTPGKLGVLFDPDDREKSAREFKKKREEMGRQIGSGQGPSIAGVEILPVSIVPMPDLAGICAEASEKSDEPSAIDYMWHDIAATIDTGLPEGTPFMPMFVFDPTYAVDLSFFVDLMVEIGIPAVDVPDFVLKNLEGIGEPISKLAACDFEGFAEGMAELDPNIDQGKALEAAEKMGCPPFELPELGIIPFALPVFELPNFSLNITPIELVLPDINFDFPQLHITILWFIQELINAIMELISMAIELALKIIEGIIEFILFCVSFIITIIMEILMAILAELMKFVGFVIGLITLIVESIKLVILCIVGYLIGAGMIAMAVFNLL